MIEEKKYIKNDTKCNPIDFNPKERWLQMKDLSDGSYFISSFGRVMRLNKQGVFHEIKKALFCKSIYVSIEFNRGNSISYSRKRVGKLVLKYFVGGATQNRRYVHLDGDIKNCKLKNLRWKKGFISDIDIEYLSKLPNEKLNNKSLIVKDFLLTNDAKNIFSLLESYKRILKYIDVMNKTNYLKSNDYMSFCLIVIEEIKTGGFKPNVEGKETISFDNYIKNLFRNISYNNRKTREFNLFENSKEIGYIPSFVGAAQNDVYF